MKFVMQVDDEAFQQKLRAAVGRVEKGTKKATKAACEELLEMSLAEVPRETDALASSAFYEVKGSYRNFRGIVGYGGNGDPINPKTGLRVSQYMVTVHEDLSAYHPVGKAKFLEDPLRRYEQQFPTNVRKSILEELLSVFKGGG